MTGKSYYPEKDKTDSIKPHLVHKSPYLIIILATFVPSMTATNSLTPNPHPIFSKITPRAQFINAQTAIFSVKNSVFFALKITKCVLILVHSAVNVCSHRCERLFIAL